MVSGWAIKACLGSWPFSLGVREGHSRKMCEWPEPGVGAELLDGLRPSSGVREDPGDTLLAPGMLPSFHAFIS